MVVFSYQDYLACKKIINSNLYIKEDSSDYYVSTNNVVHNVHDAMAIDKCKFTSQLLNIINKLSIILDDNRHKKYMKRIIKYILSVHFDENTTATLLNKFNERNDVTMKYFWDYIREDDQRRLKKENLKGKREGKREGKLEFIKAMLNNGETIEKIMLYTKFSKDEIEKLRDEMAV